MNIELATKALQSFVATINATGGVTPYTNDNNGGPVIDPDWLDLGDAYREACTALGVPPKIQGEDTE